MNKDKNFQVEAGLEGTDITIAAKKCYDILDRLSQSHPEVSAIIIVTNGKQGSDTLIGDTEVLATEFMQVANKHSAFMEVLIKIIKAISWNARSRSGNFFKHKPDA